ncbi:hypothetical protein FTO70_02605 [Methanosarcina sp. KYL-1]|nr:hypothetical protein [Methanosarcina sp. KYL-1]
MINWIFPSAYHWSQGVDSFSGSLYLSSTRGSSPASPFCASPSVSLSVSPSVSPSVSSSVSPSVSPG